ncbi:MAG: copper chaperone PCu(A)C [Caulobacteraceae bacterium]|nr:copper chaperone PCu(A)C [Caulobacteraceae bacterium]
MSKPLFAGRLAAGLLVLSAGFSPALALDVHQGALILSHPWSRPTPPSAPTGAGYLTITNHGSAPDRLIAAASPAANQVQIHQMSMAGGIMTMRPVEGGIVIAPGATVSLAPGGYHLMFIAPRRPFKLGDQIPVSLTFERSGTVKLDLTVETPPAPGDSMPGMAMPVDPKGGH